MSSSNAGQILLALREVLEGGEWHPLSAFLSVCRARITPERASRAWLHEEKYRLKRLKGYDPAADISEELDKTPYEERVTFGVRRLVSNTLSMAVMRGEVERKKVEGVNHYRLTPATTA